MAAQEARWLTYLMAELGYPQQTPTLWLLDAVITIVSSVPWDLASLRLPTLQPRGCVRDRLQFGWHNFVC
ncbi:hypothetical protein CLOM_g12094 [Closterium sp. NIES-68]|nr:hypothetical protein CLOM_g12094 [Closterium sp. NIES-68]